MSVPGSSLHFTRRDIREFSVTKDWFPQEHAALPAVLARSRAPESFACGFCHLPNGAGRPENAKVAGLSAAYIVSEVRAMRGGQRRVAKADYLPAQLMRDAVAGLSDVEISAAADYFSAQTARSYLRVVERTYVPQHQVACYVYRRSGEGRVKLGSAILEMPDDFDAFEARDPHATYTAYVPIGSVARGRLLANSGARVAACGSCHGANLMGDAHLPGPPLAGRFATYLFRQLYDFKAGVRKDAAAAMRRIVEPLTQSDLIDLAAYSASLQNDTAATR